MSEANRAILLTAPGAAAIAVVRMVGPRVKSFLESHFSRPAKAGRPVHGKLSDGDLEIDDPVVVLDATSRFVDVNLHGGTQVLSAFFDLARRAGFEIIDRVELPLPEDAVDAETTLEREVLRYLPLAKTELAVRTLLAQPVAWESIRNVLTREILADRSLQHLLHPPRVAIIGAPNVGKSTIANQLFAQERSITADLPGTTRDWVGEIANLDGLAVMLVDTPGQRETSDPIEREAIAASHREIAAADVVVIVLDPSQLSGVDRSMLEKFPAAILVHNKSDLPARVEVATSVKTIATRGIGIDALRKTIRQKLGCDDIDPTRPRIWTDRQKEILQRAILNPEVLTEI